MSLLLLAAALSTGFNIGAKAESVDEAGVNDSMKDQLLGEDRQLETFPEEANTNPSERYDNPVGEQFKTLLLLPMLKMAVGVIDWGAAFYYQNRHLPMTLFQGGLVLMVISSCGLIMLEVRRVCHLITKR